jgi:hypothetical protein
LRPSAAREAAPAVTHNHCPSHPRRHDRSAPTNIEGLGTTPSQNPRHTRVAREAAGGLGSDRADIGELASQTKSALEALQIDRDHHVRPLAGDLGPVRAVEPAAAELGQDVRPALGCGPRILDTVPRPRILYGAEGGDQRLSGLGVEVAIDTDRALDRGGYV